jgi:hypothetical protein
VAHPDDPYLVLGVGRSADAAEIRTAYRALIRAAHPDAGGDQELAARVNVAYRVLSDPDARLVWDAAHPPATALRAPVPSSPPPPGRSAPPPPRTRGTAFTPPPPGGRRPPLVLAGVVVVVAAVLVGLTGGERSPDGGVDDPYRIEAGDCIDLDAAVPVDVPCDSPRSDGRVVGVVGAADACPSDAAAHAAMGGVVHCVVPHSAFAVRGCVAIEGTLVQPTTCGPNPDAVVNAIVSDPATCPLGTTAVARVDDTTHVCLVQP